MGRREGLEGEQRELEEVVEGWRVVGVGFVDRAVYLWWSWSKLADPGIVIGVYIAGIS